MRPSVTVGLLLAMACLLNGCGTAYDEPQPWCTIDPWGSQKCFYRTKEQCLEQVWGFGGTCVPNPEMIMTGSQPRPRKRSLNR